MEISEKLRAQKKARDEIERTLKFLKLHGKPILSLDEIRGKMLIGLIPLAGMGFYAFRNRADRAYHARISSSMQINPDTEIWHRVSPDFCKTLIQGALPPGAMFSSKDMPSEVYSKLKKRIEAEFSDEPGNIYEITSRALRKRIKKILSKREKEYTAAK